MPSDAELVRDALGGNREAAGQIYDRYVPLVRAIARDASSSSLEADELVQEIFLRVLTQLGTLRQPDHLAGWIVQIARNQVTEFQRRTVKSRQREGPVTLDPVDLRIAEPREEIERVRSAIEQLQENERLAVHLFYLCEQSAEVAQQVLGLSSSGFYKTIEKARTHLRAILSKEESSR